MENETRWEASNTLLRAVHQGRGHHSLQFALAFEAAVLRTAAPTEAFISQVPLNLRKDKVPRLCPCWYWLTSALELAFCDSQFGFLVCKLKFHWGRRLWDGNLACPWHSLCSSGSWPATVTCVLKEGMCDLGSEWMVGNHGVWLYRSAVGSPPSPFMATPSSRDSCDLSFLTRAQGQSLVAWK